MCGLWSRDNFVLGSGLPAGDGALDLEHGNHALLEAVPAVHEGGDLIARLPECGVRREDQVQILRRVVLERREAHLEHVGLSRWLLEDRVAPLGNALARAKGNVL